MHLTEVALGVQSTESVLFWSADTTPVSPRPPPPCHQRRRRPGRGNLALTGTGGTHQSPASPINPAPLPTPQSFPLDPCCPSEADWAHILLSFPSNGRNLLLRAERILPPGITYRRLCSRFVLRQRLGILWGSPVKSGRWGTVQGLRNEDERDTSAQVHNQIESESDEHNKQRAVGKKQENPIQRVSYCKFSCWRR